PMESESFGYIDSVKKKALALCTGDAPRPCGNPRTKTPPAGGASFASRQCAVTCSPCPCLSRALRRLCPSSPCPSPPWHPCRPWTFLSPPFRPPPSSPSLLWPPSPFRLSRLWPFLSRLSRRRLSC